ncbi:MAG: hypothetical protein H6Q35_2474 [Proteobacteria bacterium]|nr:hypothetical protein [Pseudomonadota bacterium]MBS1229251.1 hypothetical protein [Pseudomonadota bacterium]
MKKSNYFSELIKSYIDEIDDLVSDSAGKSVLQKRLDDKRGEFDSILPMIEFSTEMVAVVFYDAFDFKSPEIMQQIVQSEPDDSDFIGWDELKAQLAVSAWAQPLIASSLKVRGGDAFLVTAAALEFLRSKPSSYESPAVEVDDEGDERADDGEDDLSEAGADWLAEQGFETLDR